MANFFRPRIPKPFRTARPMASGPARGLPAWLDVDAAAMAAGMLVAAVSPLADADAAARAWALMAVGDAAPSERVALLTVSPEALRAGGCDRALAEALRRGEARGALLLEPTETLCKLEEGASPPVAPLAVSDLHLRGGSVVGFGPGAAAAFGVFGQESSPWVMPRGRESVPVVSLGDLDRKAVPATVLRGRVALVAVGEEGALPPGDGAAAALGGLLEGGARQEAPRWVAPLFVLAAGLSMRFAVRRGVLAASVVMVAMVAVLLGGQVLLAGRIPASLLALASAVVGLGLAFAGVLAAGTRRTSSAARRAGELLERTKQGRLEEIRSLPDAEFWLRVARLAEQAHPSEVVLVADLPPSRWHLRFWNERQGGERIVAEQRRDVRRSPFSDAPGVYKIQALTGFLSRAEMPVIAVPLLASGELEGYVFLCGSAAESAFAREPERAERLGRELGLLARRRRLARGAAAQGAVAGAEEELVDGVRGALGDLRLLGAAIRGVPAAALVADAFGDVRVVSREFAAWLKGRDVVTPPDGPGGTLAPGSLSLGDVLAAVRGIGAEKGSSGRASSQILSRVMERDEGLDLPVTGPEPGVLHVRAVRQEAEGLSWIAGYVATLTRAEVSASAANVRSITGRDSFDPLVTFALGELVTEAVTACGRSSGRPLKLEPIRGATHTLGHRSELAQALEAFLLDMSSRALPGHQPVVSVRETPQGPQLSVLDVGFGMGLPESALERVLVAPSTAPAGLETLGRLIVAVEDSHGQAELRTNDGWGITLVLTMLRAQPRMSMAPESTRAAPERPSTPERTSSPNVFTLGRKQG
ncbi:hypothetical protein [Chondromyces crocatus]|uniref:Uncharacterized protein n=1 Tax=Chondromyces crocatus TaxID=52 RepID=A0A0K1E7K1_CHOCO|nr:hypothetical protein [Chondromyces crocatus]AKT36861.1 uncharacterized protein CMC5_009820 [Chondromyces crocatus]